MLEVAIVDAPLYVKYAKMVSEKLSAEGILHHIIMKENKSDLLHFLRENKEAIGIYNANAIITENIDLHTFALFKREDARALLLALSEEIHLENFVRSMKIATESPTIKGYLSHYFPDLETVLVENLADSALENLQNGKYDACILPHYLAESHQLLPYKVQRMNVMAFIPECGEGILGIFGQEKEKYKDFFYPHFHHQASEILLQTEMAFELEIRKNGCYPTFAFATSIANSLSLTAGIVAENGTFLYKQSVEGQVSDTEKIGKSLAFRILENL